MHQRTGCAHLCLLGQLLVDKGGQLHVTADSAGLCKTKLTLALAGAIPREGGEPRGAGLGGGHEGWPFYGSREGGGVRVGRLGGPRGVGLGTGPPSVP